MSYSQNPPSYGEHTCATLHVSPKSSLETSRKLSSKRYIWLRKKGFGIWRCNKVLSNSSSSWWHLHFSQRCALESTSIIHMRAALWSVPLASRSILGDFVDVLTLMREIVHTWCISNFWNDWYGKWGREGKKGCRNPNWLNIYYIQALSDLNAESEACQSITKVFILFQESFRTQIISFVLIRKWLHGTH